MKDLIIKELIEHKGTFISGQQISKKYHITRANVWKYIQKLKEEGYQIDSVTNKGYRLLEVPDRLDMAYLEFDEKWIIGKEYLFLEEIDSTNSYAKKIAPQRQDGTVVLSENQTKGKGRLGRDWKSSYGTGIWMSLILKPDIIPKDAVLLTQVAAAAVVKGINEVLDCGVRIKWPNDIVLGNKKVCGILTELSGEIESINYIVIGIGINVNQNPEDFPQEIEDKATSLKKFTGADISRKAIIKAIMKYMNNYYLQFLKSQSLEGVVEVCREFSATLKKEVRVIQNGKEICGEAIDLSDRGALIVEDREGNRHEIISGEASVRGMYHYVD